MAEIVDPNGEEVKLEEVEKEVFHEPTKEGSAAA